MRKAIAITAGLIAFGGLLILNLNTLDREERAAQAQWESSLLPCIVNPSTEEYFSLPCRSGDTIYTEQGVSQPQGSASAAQYPTDCPAGFVDALGATLPATKSAAKVKRASLGLGALGPRIACAVRSRPIGGEGVVNNTPYTYVVMQADVSESEVRDELESLGFGEDGYSGNWTRSWEREPDGAPGEIWGVNFMTFADLIGDGPQWSKFRDAFPPQTVVLWGSQNPYASG